MVLLVQECVCTGQECVMVLLVQGRRSVCVQEQECVCTVCTEQECVCTEQECVCVQSRSVCVQSRSVCVQSRSVCSAYIHGGLMYFR